ncbi:Kazal-type serine protease inhibitor domain-containing protein [Bradyrhizobium zhanjiangense]|uniref:Kazal domain-containing protein n=1 Tax=Bradyrhizobium zhanjiangense TaxID=1325107 RepID=A0A4Q0Q6J0_9BRAD|nr:Kazal-type serine protease inhibitor domain-containing protein [Bradyrhizobium zhanjiangense]RXG84822.1 Kazal domain-containing protein [Bradyrhizobium zhanjiangense]
MRKRVLIGAIFTLSTFFPSIEAAQAAKVGQMCGGFAGVKCDEGLWCDPQPGKCGVVDAVGKCIKVPEVCTATKKKDYRPVCGCDNNTYSNNCVRQSKMVALKHLGPCK